MINLLERYSCDDLAGAFGYTFANIFKYGGIDYINHPLHRFEWSLKEEEIFTIRCFEVPFRAIPLLMNLSAKEIGFYLEDWVTTFQFQEEIFKKVLRFRLEQGK